MGFWDVTKRLIQGKPGFEEPSSNVDDWGDDAPTVDYAEEREAQKAQAADDDLIDDRGYKQIPVVEVVYTKYLISGANMEVWSTIRNQSARELELDKIMMLGTKHELDYRLQPGQQREFRLYSGPRPNHNSYKKAELYYKDMPTGDYFRADHIIDYKYETDKTYSVVELKLIRPIYDI
jgi:hypothetical protein